MAKRPLESTKRIQNRKARHEYEIIDEIEVGMVLKGSEVKSLRTGSASLDEAYAFAKNGEIWLIDCNISPYPNATVFNHPPKRERKLLLHRRELNKWSAKAKEKGLTLVPLEIFFNERGIAKLRLGLARGKTFGDKRHSLRERDVKREMDRALRRG